MLLSSLSSIGSGNYSFTGLGSGNFRVIATLDTFSFSPVYQDVTLSDSDQADVNFTSSYTGGTEPDITITGLSGTSGSPGKTLTITVSGASASDIKGVKFGSVNMSVINTKGTTQVVTGVPLIDSGNYDLTVYTDSKVSGATAFTINDLPNTGVPTGQVVTDTETNLKEIGDYIEEDNLADLVNIGFLDQEQADAIKERFSTLDDMLAAQKKYAAGMSEPERELLDQMMFSSGINVVLETGLEDAASYRKFGERADSKYSQFYLYAALDTLSASLTNANTAMTGINIALLAFPEPAITKAVAGAVAIAKVVVVVTDNIIDGCLPTDLTQLKVVFSDDTSTIKVGETKAVDFVGYFEPQQGITETTINVLIKAATAPLPGEAIKNSISNFVVQIIENAGIKVGIKILDAAELNPKLPGVSDIQVPIAYFNNDLKDMLTGLAAAATIQINPSGIMGIMQTLSILFNGNEAKIDDASIATFDISNETVTGVKSGTAILNCAGYNWRTWGALSWFVAIETFQKIDDKNVTPLVITVTNDTPVDGAYLVVDLSSGDCTELELAPSDLLTNDEYKTTKMVMVKVENGTFQMGADDSDAYSNEQPVHSVTLTEDFYVGIFEVTQKQYETVTGSNPSDFSGDTLPVETVSWDNIRGGIWPDGTPDSTTFMGILNSRSEKRFDLLTEAQWEFAARGGNKSQGYEFSGSDTVSDVAWYDSNSGDKTHAVGGKTANELGIYDMSGNVWEWCLDWYDEDYYSSSPPSNPQGASSGSYRALRGGSWDHNGWFCRSTYRISHTPSDTLSRLGFRVALPAVQSSGYLVGGTVTGDIQDGVTVTLTPGDYTTLSAADGTYTIENIPDGTYTATPSHSGYTFTPSSSPVTVSGASVTGTDFVSKTGGTPVDGAYLVVDLATGDCTELDSAPSDLLTNAEYKTTKMVLRKITSGSFTMGSPTTETGHQSNETQHTVTLTKDFHIGIFEVTQKQYETIMGSNPSTYTGDKRPVEKVSWNAVRGGSWPSGDPGSATFFGKLNTLAGKSFDLPTEAQWEYACRAGTTKAYNNDTDCLTTGDGQDTNLDPLAWYRYNAYSQSKQHQEVGTKQANNWGLYDMHGNVWEWCLDWYGSYGVDETDPEGATSGSNRVLRGGSWYHYAGRCRSAYRTDITPSGANRSIGFRVGLPAGQ